jgi:hypothetical protein
MSERLIEINFANPPSSLPSSHEVIHQILSTIKTYINPVEWHWYLNFAAHILCRTSCSHIAVANLKRFLFQRPSIQIWHEALLSELHSEMEPNLPSELSGVNFVNPVVQRFKAYTKQRFEHMTQMDVFVARCVMIDYIYTELDSVRVKMERILESRELEATKQQYEAVQQRSDALKMSRESHLKLPVIPEATPTGQIGIVDLASLLDALVLTSVPEIPLGSGDVVVSTNEKESWVKGLFRSIRQMISASTPAKMHYTGCTLKFD